MAKRGGSSGKPSARSGGRELQQPQQNSTKAVSLTELRDKNANAFDGITQEKLKNMSTSKLKTLSRKGAVYNVGQNQWSPKTEAEALARHDALIGSQSRSSLIKDIMKAKKLAKPYKK